MSSFASTLQIVKLREIVVAEHFDFGMVLVETAQMIEVRASLGVVVGALGDQGRYRMVVLSEFGTQVVGVSHVQ